MICTAAVCNCWCWCRDFPAGVEPDWESEDDIVSELVLLGIVGIQDPVRPEVRDTILV